VTTLLCGSSSTARQTWCIAAGCSRSPLQARQLVSHAHITVNGRLTKDPSFDQCGRRDWCTEVSRTRVIQESSRGPRLRRAGWIEVDPDTFVARITSYPRPTASTPGEHTAPTLDTFPRCITQFRPRFFFFLRGQKGTRHGPSLNSLSKIERLTGGRRHARSLASRFGGLRHDHW